MKQTTSDRLRILMQERNLRQADILNLIQPYCEKFNVKIPRNALSQYVTGKVVPKQDKLTILGLALNVSEIWLMGHDVPRERIISVEKSELTASELELLQCFRACNSTGQELIFANARVYAGNPDMQKSHDNNIESAM